MKTNKTWKTKTETKRKTKRKETEEEEEEEEADEDEDEEEGEYENEDEDEGEYEYDYEERTHRHHARRGLDLWKCRGCPPCPRRVRKHGQSSASDPPPTGGPEAPPRPPTQAGDLECPSADQVTAEEDPEKQNLRLQLRIEQLKLELNTAKLEAIEDKNRELLAEAAWKSSSESVTSSGVA